MKPFARFIPATPGVPLFCGWSSWPEPAIAAALAREGFDAVVLDMQHGAIDYAAAVCAIDVLCAMGKPALARIPVGAYALASQLLDAGAAGVVSPMINSAADARAFAASVKYPPLGERSWGPHRAMANLGVAPADYLAGANMATVAFAMVETAEALAACETILAEPGIDGVFLGPADLSLALTNGRDCNPLHPDVDKAIDRVSALAKAAGKFVAIYAHTAERGRELAAKGADIVAVSSDHLLLRSAAKQALAVAQAR